MNMHLNHTSSILLNKGQVLGLDDAMECTIVCNIGCVWVTEESVVKDFFLIPGESLMIDHHGLTVVNAMDSSCITLRESPHDRSKSDSIFHFLGSCLAMLSSKKNHIENSVRNGNQQGNELIF